MAFGLSLGLYGMRNSTVFFASEVEGGQNADTSNWEGETKHEECAVEENVKEYVC
jgi:hypothetical protein